MSNFFTNLMARHIQQVADIKPRLRGRFEPDSLKLPAVAETDEQRAPHKSAQSETTNPVDVNKSIHERTQQLPAMAKNTITSEAFPAGQEPLKSAETVPFISSAVKKRTFGENQSGQEPLYESQDIPDQRISKKTAMSLDSGQKSRVSSPEKRTGNEPNPVKKAIRINPKAGEEKNLPDNKVQPVSEEKDIKPSKKQESVEPGKTITKEQPLHLPDSFVKWMTEPVSDRSSLGSDTQATPTIKVNIGRIEVRAVTEQPHSPVARKPAFKPKLTLEDYLKQRNGGKR